MLATLWRLLAWAHGTSGRYGLATGAAERAMEHARRANDGRQIRLAAVHYALAALHGPTPCRGSDRALREDRLRSAGRPTHAGPRDQHPGGAPRHARGLRPCAPPFRRSPGFARRARSDGRRGVHLARGCSGRVPGRRSSGCRASTPPRLRVSHPARREVPPFDGGRRAGEGPVRAGPGRRGREGAVATRRSSRTRTTSRRQTLWRTVQAKVLACKGNCDAALDPHRGGGRSPQAHRLRRRAGRNARRPRRGASACGPAEGRGRRARGRD